MNENQPDGFVYKYSEGGMIYPDALDNASRTIITGEGGKSPSRFKHVVVSDRGLRRLTPIELERLNMFPDNHTKLEGITDTKRAFFMGNALVVGVIEKIGEELYKQINQFEYVDITSADSIIEFAKKLKNQTLRQACGSEIEKHGYKGKGILVKY